MSNPPPSIEKSTDTWNVAQGYTNLKILKPLVEMDKLLTIALYGCEYIEDALNIDEEIKTRYRIEAINRLIDTLLLTIENSDFVMSANTKDALDALEKRIINVKILIPLVQAIKIDQRDHTQTIVINEEYFNLCVTELRNIKKEIPKPLNQKHLIFPGSDEMDLDALKNELIFGG